MAKAQEKRPPLGVKGKKLSLIDPFLGDPLEWRIAVVSSRAHILVKLAVLRLGRWPTSSGHLFDGS